MDRRRSPWPPPLGPRDDRLHPAMHTHSLPRTVRFMIGGLVLMVVVLAITIGVVTAWVVTLRDQRMHQQEREQQQIDSTFCSVLGELPADAAPLQRIREQLRCRQPGVAAGGENP